MSFPDPFTNAECEVLYSDGPLELRKVVRLLRDFNRFYEAATIVLPERATYDVGHVGLVRQNIEPLIKAARRQIPASSRDALQFISISKGSPLKFTVHGLAIAIIAAVIISGGRIEISSIGLKAELRPIGEGIAILRDALQGRVDHLDDGSRAAWRD